MNDDIVQYCHDAGGPVHEVQLALSFVTEALEELDRLQTARGTMDQQVWLIKYQESWEYFAKSHASYVTRAAALLASRPSNPARPPEHDWRSPSEPRQD